MILKFLSHQHRELPNNSPDYRSGPSNAQHKSHKRSDNRKDDPSRERILFRTNGEETAQTTSAKQFNELALEKKTFTYTNINVK
ncbi:hypothetical protein CHS0354_038527 [Potamilus streckersoni]|uniref:Uncharacterized protein n=1 Tax=Potamilus streckersoni TaxID=2493646 RepID=A0AAE0VR53_9BIVA|nr:hypothetical protein CHS0354_038527 [Potamilus streckersoni]